MKTHVTQSLFSKHWLASCCDWYKRLDSKYVISKVHAIKIEVIAMNWDHSTLSVQYIQYFDTSLPLLMIHISPVLVLAIATRLVFIQVSLISPILWWCIVRYTSSLIYKLPIALVKLFKQGSSTQSVFIVHHLCMNSFTRLLCIWFCFVLRADKNTDVHGNQNLTKSCPDNRCIILI